MIPIKNSNSYQGYQIVPATDERVAKLYAAPNENVFDLKENEYLAVDNDGKITACLKWQNKKYVKVDRKVVKSAAIGDVRAKNIEQRFAIDMLQDPRTTVKVMTGGFGSGKTFLACACAFKMLQDGQFDKIMWIRNNIEVKNSNPIGFLKGDYDEKMMVWAMPLADHIGGEDVLKDYIDRKQIEVVHLGFLRGRDIKHSIIFCSEAEHLTREHVQLLLGRVSQGSVLILEGDYRQIDKKAFEVDNGISAAVKCLAGQDLFAYINLTQSVRSDTAKLADLLDEKGEPYDTD